MTNCNFNIIGPGAIGHLWYSFLTLTGFSATLYARKPINTRQFYIESSTANFSARINYQCLEQWQDSDAILICVKAHQLDQLCQQLVKNVTQTCPIILMMNGMGLIEIVESYLPQNPVIHASLTHGAYIRGDTLFHTGKGETLLGNLDSDYPQSQFAPLISIMNAALPEVIWNIDHQRTMHLKLLVNAIINPVTALLRIKNGEIVREGQLIEAAESLLLELAPLLPMLLPAMSFEQVRQRIINIALDTSSNTSSMLQDVLNKQQTEIDYINGYLVTIAERHSIPLPQHSQIIQQIKQLNAE